MSPDPLYQVVELILGVSILQDRRIPQIYSHSIMMKTSFSAWEYLWYAAPIFVEGFTAGWETGSIGGVLAMPQFLNYFNYPSSFRQGSMTAALLAGEFGGSLFMGFLLADRLGRKRTIYFAILVYIIGQVLVVASVDQAMFIASLLLSLVSDQYTDF